jgi:hypothetical protein
MKGFGEGVRRMTEKRYVIEEIGNMFRVLKDNEPLTTKFENCDKQDVTNLIAELNEFDKENKELKSLCKVLITHIDEKSIAFVIDEDVRRLLE